MSDTMQQPPNEPELSPLPPIPTSLKAFWLHDLLSQITGTEKEAQVYTPVGKAVAAIQAELFAAENIHRALAPEKNATVALHNKLANVYIAVCRLTEAAELWREAGDLALQTLYGSGSAIDAEGLAYATRVRRSVCLRQALTLLLVLLEIDRKRLEDTGHQPMVFL